VLGAERRDLCRRHLARLGEAGLRGDRAHTECVAFGRERSGAALGGCGGLSGALGVRHRARELPLGLGARGLELVDAGRSCVFAASTSAGGR
jgi:hypothetical protein